MSASEVRSIVVALPCRPFPASVSSAPCWASACCMNLPSTGQAMACRGPSASRETASHTAVVSCQVRGTDATPAARRTVVLAYSSIVDRVSGIVAKSPSTV